MQVYKSKIIDFEGTNFTGRITNNYIQFENILEFKVNTASYSIDELELAIRELNQLRDLLYLNGIEE